jgi:hypothetical protein
MSIKKIYVCDQCDKEYKSSQALGRHKRVKHEGVLFACDHCDKTFGEKGHLKTHVRLVHLKEQPFECKECHKKFGLKGNLKKHVRTVHLKEQIFECKECHKKFGQKGTLKTHVRTIHLKEQNFECKECHKKFGQKGTLRTHIKMKHDKIKDKQCPKCDYKCSTSSSLKRHIKSHKNDDLRGSSGEREIMNALDELNIQYIYDKPFGGLYGVSGTNLLRWDFRVPISDDNHLFIEYDGIQHFKPTCFNGIDYNKAVERFEKNKEHDDRKNTYCSINDFKLLRISVFEKKYIKRMVRQFIQRYSDLLKEPVQPKKIVPTDVIINIQKSKIPTKEKLKLILKVINT